MYFTWQMIIVIVSKYVVTQLVDGLFQPMSDIFTCYLRTPIQKGNVNEVKLPMLGDQDTIATTRPKGCISEVQFDHSLVV